MKQKIVKTKSNVKNIKLPTIENETHKSIIKEIDHFQNIISSIGIIGLANRIYESKLPIKCLEAVVLAMKLTNHINDLKRFTITFHSVCEGKKYKHIVLGVHVGNRYGAIGLSRRDSLMYKPVIYRKFSQLIKNYSNSYLEHEHALVYVGVGLPIPHDIYSCQKLIWKVLIYE
ncbi:hypothetical protein A3Q56_06364 [Intoshia linei]|uniref:Uncharacterized protein n=1 Tax=Intoshia linei TaxID=1819745 RepID=A0A177AVP7_9BILA|nr:hypothetical protein A3Q56_06364 [Intoshia linei]